MLGMTAERLGPCWQQGLAGKFSESHLCLGGLEVSVIFPRVLCFPLHFSISFLDLSPSPLQYPGLLRNSLDSARRPLFLSSPLTTHTGRLPFSSKRPQPQQELPPAPPPNRLWLDHSGKGPRSLSYLWLRTQG